jgi:transposase
MDASTKSDTATQAPGTRRIRTLAEKLSILRELDDSGASVAAVARRHGMNANLLFAWRRLHRRGLLESQRHAPPLLPVKITSPTIAPTLRASSPAKSVQQRAASVGSMALDTVEIILAADVRVRLSGDAQRQVLERILGWLPRR